MKTRKKVTLLMKQWFNGIVAHVDALIAFAVAKHILSRSHMSVVDDSWQGDALSLKWMRGKKVVATGVLSNEGFKITFLYRKGKQYEYADHRARHLVLISHLELLRTIEGDYREDVINKCKDLANYIYYGEVKDNE